MIVAYRHLGRALGSPPECDSPLLVDPDGVQSAELSPQRLKPIARRDTQIFELMSTVKLD